MGKNEQFVVDVNHLSVTFNSGQGVVAAVRDVSFSIKKGSFCAMAGESGCGKSVTAFALTRLLPDRPACQVHGGIEIAGQNLMDMSSRELQRLRGHRVAYVFQEPGRSLNPVIRIGAQVAEAIYLHRKTRADQSELAHLFELVQLPDPQKIGRRYPCELSGGQQQRVMIAMALACDPEVLIADEPTTALDVTIQAEIMQLLRTINRERGTTILFISHNLGLIADVADYIYVMYAGKIVESGSVLSVLNSPMHPYTQALLHAVPRLHGHQQWIESIPGSVPDPTKKIDGCAFASRCKHRKDACDLLSPELVTVSSDRSVACHYHD